MLSLQYEEELQLLLFGMILMTVPFANAARADLNTPYD